MEDVWTRNERAESDNCIRCWEKDDATVEVVDVRDEEGDTVVKATGPSEERFLIKSDDGDIADDVFRSTSLCAAVNWCVDQYGVVPEESVWRGQDDAYYIVLHAAPHQTQWNHYIHPEDKDQLYVFCETPDHDSEEGWVPRQDFADGLELISCGVF